MDWIKVSILAALLIGLTEAGDKKAKDVAGRYLLVDNILRQSENYKNLNLQNGSVIKQKITNTEFIAVVQDVPDNESYVVSRLNFYLYVFRQQLTGQEVQVKQEYTNEHKLHKIEAILNRNKNNPHLSHLFKEAIRKSLEIIERIKHSEVIDKVILKLINAILGALQQAITKNIEDRRFERGKYVLVEDVDEALKPYVKDINKNSEYSQLVAVILKDLLTNEPNKTIVDNIEADAKRAADMFNMETKKEGTIKVFEIIIRALSFIDYRLQLAKADCDPPKSDDIPPNRVFAWQPIDLITTVPLIYSNALRKIVIKHNIRDIDTKRNIIVNILMDVMERTTRSSIVRTLYPPGKNLTKILKAHDNSIQEVILSYQLFLKTGLTLTLNLNVKPLEDAVLDRFENALLDRLEDLDQLGFLPSLKATIRDNVVRFLNTKDSETIGPVTYNNIKRIAQEFGLTIIEEGVCGQTQACEKTSNDLQQSLELPLLQNFLRYKNERLFDINFASNLLEKKSSYLQVYKVWDEEFKRNGYKADYLPERLCLHRDNYNKLLIYYRYYRSLIARPLPKCTKKVRTIYYNNNPTPPNSVHYAQSVHDLGYLITLEEPFKLVDASIRTHVSVSGLDSQVVKSFEIGKDALYINKGDNAGEIRRYITVLTLEYITPDFENVKLTLKTSYLVDAATFKVKHNKLKHSIKVHVRGINYLNSVIATNIDWELTSITRMTFDPIAVVEDAANLLYCSE